MRRILFIGAEALPFAATGGLGDVLGSLPAEIQQAGGENVDVRVIMPLYKAVSDSFRAQMTTIYESTVRLGWRQIYVGIRALKYKGVTYYFVDNEQYFGRDGKLYGHFDDAERYAYFCEAALSCLPYIDFVPDVLHAHDWQAALAIIYLKLKYKGDWRYGRVKTVFTIHNIEYQGKYDPYILGNIFGIDEKHLGLMTYDNCINLMKAAIECCDMVSTVSPTYASEIKDPTFSHGLHHQLIKEQNKLRGILNGIDYDLYNPETDPVITAKYSAKAPAKKAANKKALQQELALPVRDDVPMVALISRLVSHKGLDLFTPIADKLLEDDIQLVVLGMGDQNYEDFMHGLEERHRDKVRSLILYNRDTSKKIYAACDIFLMPSKSEPCGLSQMIASRYGAIPVVRETGGLYDSIKPYYEVDGEMFGNGFTFANYSADELFERTNAAISLWRDKATRRKLVMKIMKTDFSWGASAEKYLQMYDELF
ncbi:MAG: glycogen synthase [Clostridia bacterium]|nr:glycogen synthase [Clostridia bacterium]